MQKEKEYTNGRLTVVWNPGLCIHSGNCVKGLPAVFKPGERPWIQMVNASDDALRETIARCPSGALSHYTSVQQNNKEAMENEVVKIEVCEPGPLIVSGNIEVKHANGEVETRKRAAFCRCGKSGNQPLCDGSHKA